MNNQLNAKQTAKLNSYQATKTHVAANAAIIAAVPAFQRTFQKIRANIVAIREAAQEKSVALEGITADKAAAREELSALTQNVAGLIYAYASETGDNALREEMRVPASKLIRMRDANLAPFCQNIHDKAQANLTALADYNLNAAKLAELQTAIDDFTQAAPQPRHAVTNRSTTNANLTTLFRDTDDLLENQFDKQIESLRTAHPDFVNTYFETRIIVDPPTRAKKTEDTASKNSGEPPK